MTTNGTPIRSVQDHPYLNADGAQVIKRRTNYTDGSKSFKWPIGTKMEDILPFGSEDLKRLQPGEPLLILEGENTVDAVARHGFIALCMPGGSSQKNFGRLRQVLEPYSDHAVFVSPDNDKPGNKHMELLFEHLKEYHPEVRWIPPVVEAPGGDFADLLAPYREDHAKARELVLAAIATATEEPPGLTPAEVSLKRGNGEDFTDLIAEDDEPITEYVPGLFNEGTYILAGAPKLGKSWLTLSIAQGLAMGGAVLGRIMVDPCDVLYLCLEDGRRRFKRRAKMRAEGLALPERGRFEVHFTWPKLDEGGAEALEAWVAIRRAAGRRCCVVIDTGIRLRPGDSTKQGDMYRQDYEYLAQITDIMQSNNALCIVVSHTRKAEALDFIDMVIGSHGITGAVEGVMVFTRERHSKRATLMGTDKDGEEIKVVMEWNDINGGWNITDSPDEATEQKQKVMGMIHRAAQTIINNGRPMSLSELRLAMGVQRNALVEALGLAVLWGKLKVNGAGKRGDPERYDLPDGIDTDSVPGIDT